MPTAVIAFANGQLATVDEALVEQHRPAEYKAYQVAVNFGRDKRKGKPYEGGSAERDEDGYYWSAERADLLTYTSDLDLEIGDKVLVPLGNHYYPREGMVIARSSDFTGDLKEIYGLANEDVMTDPAVLSVFDLGALFDTILG